MHQDDFFRLVERAHFGSYQIRAAQIKHELAEPENRHDQSRFFDKAVYRSNDQIPD
ncbi:hypothetical protein D3C76_1831570 [compost metagenome]